MSFKLRIPGRDKIKAAPVANSANPLIAVDDDVGEVMPISGLAGLAARPTEPANDEHAVDADRWCWPQSDAMNSAEIERFHARVQHFIAHGIAENEAERLADAMVQADRRPSSTPVSLSAPAAPAPPVMRTCAGCLHLTKRQTCTEPVAAGLAETFGIRWPEPTHAADCAAFTSSMLAQAATQAIDQGPDRPYKLTQAQGDAAHVISLDDAATGLYQSRVRLIQRRGFNEQNAEDLAERLHLRDVQGDDRVLCVECSHHQLGRCNNHRNAGLMTSEVGRDFTVLMQRCAGFRPTK